VPVERVHGHTFFKQFITKDSVVVDLGANVGGFSTEMIEKFGCYCYAVEANPLIFKHIPPKDNLKTSNLAVAANSGTFDFFIAENPESSSLYFREDMLLKEKLNVPSQRLDEFVEALGIEDIDLLKMDIEGAEIEVIDSCTDRFLERVSQLTVEFHDYNGSVSKRDVTRVIRRLSDLGFLHIRMSRADHGHEDTIFVNKNRCAIRPFEFFWVQYVSRNLRGINRIVRRSLSKGA
jgi:FkbM family methyltransferase